MKGIHPSDSYYSQKSDRLQYRQLELADIDVWKSFFIDNEAQRFVGAAKLELTPIEKSTNWISKQLSRKADGEYGQLAVLERSSGNFIGVGGIIARDLDGQIEFEITYSLLPKEWGKGYATELAKHFKEYAFKHIKPSSVISIIHVENKASIHVAEKNGMKEAEKTTYMDMPVAIYRVSA